MIGFSSPAVMGLFYARSRRLSAETRSRECPSTCSCTFHNRGRRFHPREPGPRSRAKPNARARVGPEPVVLIEQFFAQELHLDAVRSQCILEVPPTRVGCVHDSGANGTTSRGGNEFSIVPVELREVRGVRELLKS